MKQIFLSSPLKIVATAMMSALVFEIALYADPKKDVTDPVLQEVISSFGPRMPKFIDKHGAGIFVVDGPVTRGSLMMALYEYDKSLKLPKLNFATKQEFDELKLKVSSMDKNTSGDTVSASHSKQDITQLINALMPNMPILLDNSLNNSKVFIGLKEQLNTLSSQSVKAVPSAAEITDGHDDQLDEIRNRLVSLEKGVVERGSGQSASKPDIGQIISELRPEISSMIDNSIKGSKIIANIEKQVNARPVGVSGSEVSERQLAEIRNRLSSLEKGAVVERGGGQVTASKPDINQIISELRPEISSMVDDSIRGSKTIANMEKQISARPADSSGSEVSERQLAEIKNKLAYLERNVWKITNPAATASGQKNDLSETKLMAEELRKSLARTRSEVAKLARRIGQIEGSSSSESESESVEDSGYSMSSLTKVSLGLGMVAAFFIAR